ncbi:MAG: MTH1187 family thiamine-binding protein [Elusimicrobia bacterium]|nr:MTH1187 family thiamine-binding protein [Elusimicrobiota bacterium]MBD3411576.1 MTH1187 family thiamine-binding protein [Elusimicrobiota bacterium]
MAVLEISVIPIGTASASLSDHVARAVKKLKKQKGVRYTLYPMGTVLEGDLFKLLRIAGAMHRSVFSSKIRRVVTVIKIDDRNDKKLSMKGKLRSVKRKLL